MHWRGTLTLLVSLVAAVACGHDTIDWQETTSATGNYVIEFPGQPNTGTMPIPNSDRSPQLTDLEADTGYYALSETPLTALTPNSLDSVVDASIENARKKLASKHGGSVLATEVSRSTGDFEGVETRRYRENLVVGGGVGAAVTGLAFYRNGAMVYAVVVTDFDIDPELAQHFLSSLRSKPAPDLRALSGFSGTHRSEPTSIS
jgi:hypothetical protein